MRRLPSATCTALLALAALAGCHRGTPPNAGGNEQPIPVCKPVQREVTDFVEYTGRTDAKDSVGIRARVTGYITEIPFKEGAEVKKDDLLFVIDPRPYQALVNQAQSQVKLYESQYDLAKTTYERDRSINADSPRAVSQQQLDQDKAAVEAAQAQIKAAQAVLDAYKLNLGFTRVTSPIDGRISRYYYTIGNLVNQDQTLLTTVVSQDPMYAYFDIDEPVMLRFHRAVNEGKIDLPKEGAAVPVFMQIQGETDFPHQGTVNFVNNAVNPSTGTLAMRGVFPNPMPKNGLRLLAPGMFVRIRLPIGKPHNALLVIDRAIGSDQGLKFVYVVDANNTVQYQRVETGALQDDGLRVIDSGLKPDDRVVVGGILRVRPRMQIQVDVLKEMPTATSAETVSGEEKHPAPPPHDNRNLNNGNPGGASDNGKKQ